MGKKSKGRRNNQNKKKAPKKRQENKPQPPPQEDVEAGVAPPVDLPSEGAMDVEQGGVATENMQVEDAGTTPEEPALVEEVQGKVFDTLEDEANDAVPELATKPPSDLVYRKPVTLYKDEATGEQYFYLQKTSFPNRRISKLNIFYTENERNQVREQVQADPNCPEILLKSVPVECYFDKIPPDPPQDLLHDESFRLSGSKILALRMRMGAQQKQAAQAQWEQDPVCLKLDVECRLGNR